MASKRVDLNKLCFFVLSGVRNPLGKAFAVEMCRRFKPRSVAVLIDADEEALQDARKEVEFLQNDIKVVCCVLDSWQQASAEHFRHVLNAVFDRPLEAEKSFELAYIVHNEGTAATHRLMEPKDPQSWKAYVQQHLYAPVALNQEFLRCSRLPAAIPKLVVNVSSSLMVQPLAYKSLMCSCKKARDMYFRSMAAGEARNRVAVLSYAPGILNSHRPERDENNNIIYASDLAKVGKKSVPVARVRPAQSALMLINILEKISFISGHDVDYYDTYNL